MATVEFFISYAGADQAWAQWIAWQLEAAGHTTRLQAWDFRAGGDFVHQMQQALTEAERLVAVLSPAYVASAFGEAEWRPVFARDPSGARGLLVPVRVAEVTPPALLATRIYVDLVGLPEPEATERLLAGISGGERPGRPQTPPVFPGAATATATAVQPPFPGPGPSISNLAPRNPHFTGRGDLLERLAEQLAGGAVAVVAAHGLGGVGKTQLALEYAHRHAGDYDLVWWVPAETRLLAIGSLAELALRLGLRARAEQAEQAAAAMAELAGRERWLVIFDNAEEPGDLDSVWPSVGGQVLVTSRNPAWGGQATRLAVDVLPDGEAVSFLLARAGSSDRKAAEALAGELGGLPLALEQAAAYLDEIGLALADYLTRYRRYRTQLLAHGRPPRYPATVATTWQLNLEQLAGDSAAVQLLWLCAFLAPEAIPPGLLTADTALLPPELAAAVGNELALDATVAALYRFSLVGRDHDGLRLHRLVGEVVRATLDPDEQQTWAAAAVGLVAAGFPADPREPASWPACARLLPHALTTTEHADRLEIAAEPTSRLLNQIGVYLHHRAEFAAARAAHQRGLRLAEATYGPDHPEVATRANNLGNVLWELGDLVGAKAYYQRALRIDEAAYGPNHPTVATCFNNLGNVLWALGDLVGARTSYERALRIDEAALGPDHPNVATRVSNLGDVLQDLGDLVGAHAHLERALRIDEAAYGPNHPKVAIRVNNLGSVLRQQGDLDGAKANFERALRIDEATYGPDHPNVAFGVNNLGRVLQELGDLVGARAYLKRALRIFEAVYGADHRNTRAVVGNLAGLQDHQ